MRDVIAKCVHVWTSRIMVVLRQIEASRVELRQRNSQLETQLQQLTSQSLDVQQQQQQQQALDTDATEKR